MGPQCERPARTLELRSRNLSVLHPKSKAISSRFTSSSEHVLERSRCVRAIHSDNTSPSEGVFRALRPNSFDPRRPRKVSCVQASKRSSGDKSRMTDRLLPMSRLFRAGQTPRFSISATVSHQDRRVPLQGKAREGGETAQHVRNDFIPSSDWQIDKKLFQTGALLNSLCQRPYASFGKIVIELQV
eukprot:3851338-Rhodomonas_salina.1